MKKMTFYPSKKLLTKQIFGLLTWSLFILLIGIILQILIPLGGHKSSYEVATTLWPIIIATILAIWIISLPLIIIWIKHLKYEITSERITIHKGIISRTEQNIPFKAITDFSLHRSPYDRLLQISSLRIQTAGQSPTATGFEGVLAGLENGSELLEELRARVKEDQLKVSFAENELPTTDGNSLRLILEEVRKIREILESKN